MRLFQLGLMIFMGLYGLDAALADSSINLCSVPGAMRIRPTGEIDGSSIVEMKAARNEVESAQVVITALDGNLERIEYDASSLQSEGGGEIREENIALHREIFVPVRHSARRASLPPGWHADPLIPWNNPYTGEEIRSPRWVDNKLEGGRFGAIGFDLWENHHEALWIDISIPKDARAGEYRGFLSVRARNAAEARIPIQLTVWDFALPDGPTHENHFGGFSYVARYYDLDRNSDRYHLLEDRYIDMMAAHRLNPPLPQRLHPRRLESGAIEVTEDFDRGLTAFVNRYALTNIEIPRAPYPDVIGKDREKSIQYYRSWYAYLKKKGWERGAYLYMLDEPNDAEAYERVRRLGAVVQEADPAIRRLVVEQPYVQNPDWGPLDEAIDIWCPLFGFVHEPSIREKLEQGDEVWSYSALVQSAPRYHPEYEKVKNDNPPYWQIDFPVLSYRIAPWLNRRYGITGLLYWSTVYWRSPPRNPWDDPGFRIRFNGDGFLFYPGDDEGIEGPVATIRLKNLRDGMEDYEYFVLLENLGGRETVDAAVRQAVPTWGSWNQDPMNLLELRRRLAEEILKRKKDS